MDDLISRQKALDSVFDNMHDPSKAYRGILEMPSAERKGKWILKYIENPKSFLNGCVKDIRCSACGQRFGFRTPYCPNCGARMEGTDG